MNKPFVHREAHESAGCDQDLHISQSWISDAVLRSPKLEGHGLDKCVSNMRQNQVDGL